MFQCIKIARIIVIPPMELQEVKGWDIHAPQRHPNRILHNPTGHASWSWHPFGKCLHLVPGLLASCGNHLPTKLTDEVLGWTVMIRQIPRGEPGINIVEHLFDGRFRVNTPMGTRHLPQAVENPAHTEIRGKLY